MRTMNFKITGGIWPGYYRSTSISLESSDIQEGYEKATLWAKKNFPDWNHIGTLSNGRALIENVIIPIKPFISRRATPRKTI